MKKTILILGLLFFIKQSFSQNTVLTLSSIDTGYVISLQITPRGQGAYVYGYGVKYDSLNFASAINGEEKASMKIPVNSALKAALLDLIIAFNTIKINSKRRSVYQSCAVIGVVYHGGLERQVVLNEKYYISQVLPKLLKFNEHLPLKARFRDFDCWTTADPPDSTSYIQVRLDHALGLDQPQNKVITRGMGDGSSYYVMYYDTVQKQQGYYRVVNLDNKVARAALHLKCLNYVNSFSIKNAAKTGDSGARFEVDYAVSGIHIKTTIRSLEIVFKDKMCLDLLKQVNAKLDKKYWFN